MHMLLITSNRDETTVPTAAPLVGQRMRTCYLGRQVGAMLTCTWVTGDEGALVMQRTEQKPQESVRPGFRPAPIRVGRDGFASAEGSVLIAALG